MNLYPHQVDGANIMAGQTGFILADEPGLGKTATAAKAAAIGHKGGKVVVICPRNVIKHWKETFESVAGVKAKNPVLIVTNYEKLDVLKQELDVDCLIVDESHKLKNEMSVKFRAIWEMANKWGWYRAQLGQALRVYLSTGTPVYSYPIDLLTSLLLTRKLDPAMAPAFKIRYCNPTRQKRGKNVVLDMRGASNLEELKALCQPFMLRRTWADAGIKMPAVSLTDLEVGAKITDPKYFEASENFKKFYVESGGTSAGASMARFTVLRHILALAKVPAATEQALDDLKAGQNSLFFTEFRDVAMGVAQGIEAQGGKALSIMGGQSQSARAQTLDEFKQAGSTPRVLVATTDSLGEGTDGLQEVCHLVNFIDLDFEPSMFVQALRRLVRIRQKHPVSVRRFFVAGDKMEAFIIENWAKKERILKALGLNSDSSLQALQRQ